MPKNIGFKVVGCKTRKFSIIGFLIMVVESIFAMRKVDYHHWAFYDKASGYWFNADGKIEKLTNKEFNRRYETIIGYDIHQTVKSETRSWLFGQVGKKYSYFAIAMITRKLFTGFYHQIIDDDKTHICTELTLKAILKEGFDIAHGEVETASIYQTQKILERVFDYELFNKYTI